MFTSVSDTLKVKPMFHVGCVLPASTNVSQYLKTPISLNVIACLSDYIDMHL